MKLPNWMLLFVLIFGAMGQYSLNAVASAPSTSLGFGSIAMFESRPETTAGDSSVNTTININKADVSALSALPGIGDKKAQAIIDYRELNGEFLSVAELVNVRGIGVKMLAKLDGYISV